MAKNSIKEKTRLDLLLFNKGLAESREKAKAMIMAGVVKVDGSLVEKPGSQFPSNSNITIKKQPKYVSRGGLKLEAALDHFQIDVKGLTLLDVGASTGGFTDCLLKQGAEKIVAVDVGYGQLDWRLREDPRVLSIERKNARYLSSADLDVQVDGAVIDVSFISLKLIVPVITNLLPDESFIISLIKPQFEVGKGQVGKGGVVRDESLHKEVIEKLSQFFADLNLRIIGCIPSPILGPKGNKEFLIYMER